ncbi:class I adenylate-forming enzyme family protein [Halorussus caseinilyticus]|uniref:Class I adenylate-forming enzyme family protein n=1 Tax=Halorussus caseinilyticus TaxID=3034025 RepID=A0ABD5WFF1_9EURY|nr:long-chain fatty acid--CoA ligase [Halorussus sp. DT72]
MNVCERFDRVAENNDDIAIENPTGEDKSYRRLRRESGYVAALLRDEGVEATDRIALHLPNDPAYLSVVLGIWRVGAIAVPIDGRWDADVTDHVVADLEPEMAITTDEYAEKLRVQTSDDTLTDVPLEQICIGADGDLGLSTVERPSFEIEKQLDEDIAKVVYTSGTTGVPKGVIHTHRNVTASTQMSIDVFDITASDGYLAAVSLARSPGIYGSALPVLCTGGSVVVQSDWDAEQWARLVEEYEPRLSLLKPEQVREAIDDERAAEYDTSSMETCLVTTGLLRAQSTFNDFRDIYGIENVINYYGQTESLAVSMARLSEDSRPNCIGEPVSVVETKLVDLDSRRELPPGNEGELLLRGDVVTPGYWNRNNEASELFTDGWLRTEDVIYQDEDGCLYFRNRLDNRRDD